MGSGRYGEGKKDLSAFFSELFSHGAAAGSEGSGNFFGDGEDRILSVP